MLGENSIINDIQKGEIELSRAFEKVDGEIKLLEIEKNIISKEDNSSIYSDRIKITMGPILKVLDGKKVPKQKRFRQYSDVYDLRKNNNTFLIGPKESVVILTNERIKLDGKHVCLIVPRISLSDVGIVVTTAYVDPYYNGVMRLHLSNLSDKDYSLRCLEAVAQCFVFELDKEADKRFKEEFPEKSVFYGQTWKGILDSDRSPFPTKKKSTESESLLFYVLKIMLRFLKENGVSLLMLISMLSFVVNIYFENQTMKKENEAMVGQLELIEDMLEPNLVDITVKANEKYGETVITVPIPRRDIAGVVCDNSNVIVELESIGEDETKITFMYEDENTLKNRKINVMYTIIRSIK